MRPSASAAVFGYGGGMNWAAITTTPETIPAY